MRSYELFNKARFQVNRGGLLIRQLFSSLEKAYYMACPYLSSDFSWYYIDLLAWWLVKQQIPKCLEFLSRIHNFKAKFTAWRRRSEKDSFIKMGFDSKLISGLDDLYPPVI